MDARGGNRHDPLPRRLAMKSALILVLLALAPPLALAQPAPDCGAVLGGGSPNVSVEGNAAGRSGDGTCFRPLGGTASILSGGRPLLRVGDAVQCPDGRIGLVVGGASSVLVEGRPAATAASRIQGCE
jgi:uncharacterized Zn-binding protein involved in type VI secretion